jgi:hypothetical protein
VEGILRARANLGHAHRRGGGVASTSEKPSRSVRARVDNVWRAACAGRAMRRSRAMPSPASTNPKRGHESTCASSGACGNGWRNSKRRSRSGANEPRTRRTPTRRRPRRVRQSARDARQSLRNRDRRLGPERRKTPQLHAGRKKGGQPRDRRRAPRRSAEQHGLSRGAAMSPQPSHHTVDIASWIRGGLKIEMLSL